MKLLHFPTLSVLAATALLALPVQSQAKDRHAPPPAAKNNRNVAQVNRNVPQVRGRSYGHQGGGYAYDARNRGRQGGANSYDARNHGHDGGRYSYDYRDHGGRYHGGGGHGYPYRYGYPYYGPSFGISYYSEPAYSYSYARGYDYDEGTAVEVQRALRRRGYYRGEVDGDVGPGTRSAIRAYQYDRRLPESGRIDGPLLRSLGV